jgi:hypothetical protein
MGKELYAQAGEGTKAAQAVRQRWFNALNELLQTYKVFPQLVNRDPKRPDANEWEFTWFWLDGKRGECFRLNSVRALLDLAFSEQLDRVKKCEYEPCEKWFFADKENQIFCSPGCRYKFHCSSDWDKERRRDWARNKYQRSKELKLGSREVARRKGAKR